jgi:NADP-dependent 3-hydroxy acid dehydrogenase YdfG
MQTSVKPALVTGTASCLGGETARTLRTDGAKVAIIDRRLDGGLRLQPK